MFLLTSWKDSNNGSHEDTDSGTNKKWRTDHQYSLIGKQSRYRFRSHNINREFTFLILNIFFSSFYTNTGIDNEASCDSKTRTSFASEEPNFNELKQKGLAIPPSLRPWSLLTRSIRGALWTFKPLAKPAWDRWVNVSALRIWLTANSLLKVKLQSRWSALWNQSQLFTLKTPMQLAKDNTLHTRRSYRIKEFMVVGVGVRWAVAFGYMKDYDFFRKGWKISASDRNRKQRRMDANS